MTASILEGDCLSVLQTLEAESFHACVTDPPYHLTSIVKRFGSENAAPAKSNGATGVYARASKGFMGKQWDGGNVAFRPETWAAVHRVLKPGAHLLAFGGERTFHRLACAIEDAGFEIRTTFLWLHGQGFPKNLNVSRKLADSLPADALCACGRDDQRIIQGFQDDCRSCCDSGDELSLTDQDAYQASAPSLTDVRARIHDDHSEDGQGKERASISPDARTDHLSSGCSLLQSARQSAKCQAVDSTLSDMASSTLSALRKVPHRTELGKLNNSHSDDDSGAFSSSEFLSAAEGNPYISQCSFCGKIKIAEGLGTAVKPAAEFVCCARKPLSEGTVAANVLKHSCGALNIDASRVGTGKDVPASPSGQRMVYGNGLSDDRDGTSGFNPNIGRWPANVAHDGSPEVLDAFARFGESKAGTAVMRSRDGEVHNQIYGDYRKPAGPDVTFGDTGTAARFFFCAKADASERVGAHPTVKPVALMEGLVRLVTSPGGRVLDPFCGTGSTLVACDRLGFDAVGIEQDAQTVADAHEKLRRMRARRMIGGVERVQVSTGQLRLDL